MQDTTHKPMLKQLDTTTVPVLHPLDMKGVEPPTQFTNPFCYEPHPLCRAAAEEVKAHLRQHKEWSQEIGEGKMFGVLVVEGGYLAAFSGLLDGQNVQPFFVPPVFDLSAPDGHYQQEMTQISEITEKIREMESRGNMDAAPDLYSRFERKEISFLKRVRKQRSIALQDWLFHHYVCLNARGEQKSVTQIFMDYYRETMIHQERFEENARTHHIPSGTGECCAPKLLHYAYLHGLRPLCMAEWWMGASPKEEVRHSGEFYPACTKKCKPLLHFMLQGLDVEESFLDRHNRELLDQVSVIYEDEAFIALNKPSGLLSVPSRDQQTSVIEWVMAHRPGDYRGTPVHRLDQDTSGILLVAKTREALVNMQQQFVKRQVHKKYIALLDGKPPRDEGTVSLPLCKDPCDPPRQIVDNERGKMAVTHYKVLSVEESESTDFFSHEPSYVTRVAFHPATGRTHQLRVHSAHADGLGCPIVGDKLYGRKHLFQSPSNYQSLKAPRLMLHAAAIDFLHPVTGEPMHLECEVPF